MRITAPLALFLLLPAAPQHKARHGCRQTGQSQHPRDGSHSAGSPDRPISRSSRSSPPVRVRLSALTRGFSSVNLKDPTRMKVIVRVAHRKSRSCIRARLPGPAYFKTKGRYYFVQRLPVPPGRPRCRPRRHHLGRHRPAGHIEDREVARIRDPGDARRLPRDLCLQAFQRPGAAVLRDQRSPAGDTSTTWTRWSRAIRTAGLGGQDPDPVGPDTTLVARVAATTTSMSGTIRRPSRTISTARRGGYYVYDITDLAEPQADDLDHRRRRRGRRPHLHARPHRPLRRDRDRVPVRAASDFRPQARLDGTVKTISRPIGAWTADWKGLPHNHEVRWPYVFVSALRGRLPGLQHDGPDQSVHRGLLRHLRRSAPATASPDGQRCRRRPTWTTAPSASTSATPTA